MLFCCMLIFPSCLFAVCFSAECLCAICFSAECFSADCFFVAQPKKYLFLIVGSCQSHQLECQSGVCKQTYAGCQGSCIPKSWFNDGIEDCYDGSDEIEIGGNIIK